MIHRADFRVIAPGVYDSLWSVLGSSSIAITVAAGMTAVIVARQIDVSIGATLGVAAYIVGVLLNAGVYPLAALAAAVSAGAALGAINGIAVAWFRVPAIIATLGTATIYRGLLFIAAPRFLGVLINADQFRANSARYRAMQFWACR